ncbi:MAG: hypothetical protein QM767_09590 [Anaeromyxobacter sp.]
MASDIQFGSVLDRSGPSKLWWLLVVPVIFLIGAAIWWGMEKVTAADAVAIQLKQAQGQLQEYEKTIQQRDQLLVKARANEDVLSTAGQATSVLYAATPDATESGVVIANPAQKAVRVHLYGLGTAPSGKQYGLVARSPDGLHLLERVLASDQGDAFVLARNVPEGTTAVELAYVPLETPTAVAQASQQQGEAPKEGAAPGAVAAAQPQGAASQGQGAGAPQQGEASQGQGSGGDGAQAGDAKPAEQASPVLAEADVTPRVAARYPASAQERGVLLKPVEEGKKGAKAAKGAGAPAER